MNRISWVAVLSCISTTMLPAQEPIPISDIKRDKPVDFATEIVPLLKQNCLACHHAKESEGGLNLETHELLVKGGDSGPGLVAKKADESLLLLRASGVQDDIMPPDDNSVGAKKLTPEQLGLIKLWIQQGAVGGDVAKPEPIAWQPIPESVRTTYALATSPDSQYVAAGHGNRVAIYDLASGAVVANLSDPAIQSISGEGAADVDMIQSIAFSPDGNRLATGGFRSVRLWAKSRTKLAAIETPLAASVGSSAISADGKRIAIVNAVGDIEIWNAENNTRTHTLRGHSATIVGLAFGGGRLVSADEAGSIVVWNSTDGKQMAKQSTNRLLTQIALAGNGAQLTAIGSDRKIERWQMNPPDGGTVTLVNATPDSIKAITDANSATFQSKPPALWIATDRAAICYAADGKVIRQLNHGGPVSGVAVSPDQAKVATAGADGKTKLWQTADGKALLTLEGSPQSSMRLAAVTLKANRQTAAVKRLAARTAELEKAVTKEDEAVKKIVEARDKATKDLVEKEKKSVEAVGKVATTEAEIKKADDAIAKAKIDTEAANKLITDSTTNVDKLKKEIEVQNKTLMTYTQQVSDAEKKIALVQKELDQAKAQADKLTKEIAAKNAAVAESTKAIADAKAKVEAAKKLSEQSTKTLAASKKKLEGEKKAAETAEAEKKKGEAEVAKRKQTLVAATQAQQRAKAAVPAHKLVVAAATQKNDLMQAVLKSTQADLTSPQNACLAVAFSPDGTHLATANADHSVRVYRVSDGLPIMSESTETRPTGVLLTAKGELCAFGQSHSAETWGLNPRWTLEQTIGSHNQALISDRVTALDFRDDGLSIAVGSGPPSRSGDIKIFAVRTGQLVRDFGDVHSDTVLGLRFSPDGRYIASAAADKTVRMLDITTGSVERSFEGHTHHVLAVDWQDDGQTLASASADQNVKVWNAETGEQRKTITGFGKEITAIAFVQASSQVATACADGNVRLHDAPNGKSIRSYGAGGDFLFALAVSPDGKTLVAGGQSGTLRFWNVADGKLIREIKK